MVGIELDEISKAYEAGKPVLSSISLKIEAGELFFLLGPSGCGKSTLLRIIAGFLPPDKGAIRFDSTEITRLPPEKRGTAMVFQNYALWPHMTVYENIEFGLSVQKMDKKERNKRVIDALDLVDLRRLKDRRIPSLSGGQQQRVALARAIVVKPKVLLMDEPLSNLDAKLRENMRSQIRRICKEAGLTAIYVTHDQKEALSMADRIAVLHEGTLQQVGTPRELYAKPQNRFVADFIGAGNFIPGTIKNRKGETAEVETPIGMLRSHCVTGKTHPGTKVTVLLRPEMLRFTGNGEGVNRFSGTIVNGAFVGDICQWTVQSAEHDVVISEMCPPDRSEEQNVCFEISPKDVVLLCEG